MTQWGLGSQVAYVSFGLVLAACSANETTGGGGAGGLTSTTSSTTSSSDTSTTSAGGGVGGAGGSPSTGAWLSGCYGSEVDFGQWRGTPAAVVGLSFCNTVSWDGRTQVTLDPQYSAPTEFTVLEVAYSLIDRSRNETWATGASGALDALWREGMQRVHDTWGTRKWLFIRPASEFNGQDLCYVAAGDEGDFKATWVRFYDIVQEELVQKGNNVFVTFCPNHVAWGNAVEVSDAVYPGDAYVDVIGVDYYDGNRHVDEASWNVVANSTTASGNPLGILTWQAFAQQHGKPFALPEWGLQALNEGPIDNPFFIQKMNELFRENAGSGPGQVLYEQYFEAWAIDQLHPPTEVPNSAAMYLSLYWSDGVGVAWPP